MCGRSELIDGQRIYTRFQITNTVPSILDNGDVRPTQQILMLTADRELSSAKWGLVPSWAKDPRIGSKTINARTDGIETKPSFKKPLRF